MIYLDYAASTPADPAVLVAFLEVEQTYLGNPNANHPAGQAARAKLVQVTEAMAGRLGVAPSAVLPVAGATAANLLAIQGIAQASRHLGRHILSTPLEHPSVRETLSALQAQGYSVDLVGVDRDGAIDLDQLAEKLQPDTILLALSAVDSELGAVQPIQQVAECLKDYPNCRLHVDATQAVGKIPLVLEGVDTMSIAPHKFGGLNGSGLLIQQSRLRFPNQGHPGTPALALAAAAEKALALALDNQGPRTEVVRGLNQQLRAGLARYPRVRINSPAGGVPHILNLSVQGVKGTVFQRALAQRGVCVSVRSACAEEGLPSQAVLAVTGDRRRALSSWRLSLSHQTTREELAEFFQAFDACYQTLCPAP